MEKPQTGHSRARHGSDDDGLRVGKRTGPGLRFLSPEEFAAGRVELGDRMFGAVAFGTERPSALPSDWLSAWVRLPIVGPMVESAAAAPPASDCLIETWISDRPVQAADGDGIAAARNDEVLFGCLEVDEEGDLQAATRHAYSRLFDFLDRRGYPHLLRVWNYFPRINAEIDGLERYRSFSIGRHDAFVAKGRVIGGKDVPAACALGSLSGPLVIYFFAARNAGRPIENPRQTSAYHYPAQYGPRSPTFSRALVACPEESPLLFISGTASIVGHLTVHAGEPGRQAEETVTNIRTVIEQAGFAAAGGSARLLLKAYLRDPAYRPLVAAQLERAFGHRARVIYLQADICRADLLLEVEGVRLSERQAFDVVGSPA